MMKERYIVVINGRGGSGKDTLISHFPERYTNISSIDPVKEIATKLGWNGKKDERGRRFLAELKAATDHYSDYLNNYLLDEAKTFLLSDSGYLFIHIREPENIRKFYENIKAIYGNVITVLVKAHWTKDCLGNQADDSVEDYDYDIVFTNEGTIEESAERFYKAIKAFKN